MLSPAELQQSYDTFLLRIGVAEDNDSPDAWLDLYEEWNRFETGVSNDLSRVAFEYRCHMADPDSQKAMTLVNEELVPIGTAASERFNRALLASRHLGSVLERYGQRLGDILHMSLDPLAPVNQELRREEQRIVREYQETMGSAVIAIDGEDVPLMQAMALGGSDDRDLRRRAYDAQVAWLKDGHEVLESMFDQLVSIRHRMAGNLGDPNFVRLGYLMTEKDQYDPDQVKLFSEAILEYTYPLSRELDRRHAQRLGLERIRPYDTGFDPEFDLPLGVIDMEREEAYLEEILERVSPRFGEHLRAMRDAGVMDIEARRNKYVGAFAIPFHRDKLAGICYQMTGGADDMRTLLHESGHCMQMIESMSIPAVDLRSPSTDCAEIHSIGMEFLGSRHADVFLEPREAERYRRNQWREGIGLLASVARSDLFQHWVYYNPDADPEARNDAWMDVLRDYPSAIDVTGYEEHRRRAWLQITHYFASPFYMIDYAVAEVIAMQLAMIDVESHERAAEIYTHLCRVGGTRGFNDLIAEVGLRSPFDPSLVRDLVVHAATILDVNPTIIPQ